MTAILVSSIGGAQAAGAVAMLGADARDSSLDGLWWFVAWILYSLVVAVVVWLVAVASRIPTSPTCGPRLLDESTATRRVPMRAYWELDVAHLKPEADRLGMRTNRATTKKEIVRWLMENEFPWLCVGDAEVM